MLRAALSSARLVRAPAALRCSRTHTRRAMDATSAAGTGKPREQPAGLEAEAAVLAECLLAVPSYSRGALVLPSSGSGQDLQLLLQCSQRDLESNAPRSFMQTVHVGAEGDVHAPALGFELRGALAAPSPSGRRMLVVRNPTPPASVLLLELWGGGRLLREVEVPSSTHGPVYTDGWLESFAWSADETRVAYVAEAPATVRTPLWGGRTGAKSADAGWRGQGEHVDDWGEQMTGKKQSALFVLDVPSGAVHTVSGLPAEHSCGQAVWAPGETELVFAAWPHAGTNFKTQRRLGMVYCFNRPSSLFSVAAPRAGDAASPDAAAVCLTPTVVSAFSPRFNPSASTLAFASSAAACETGAHNAALALHTLAWGAAGAVGEPRCALPVVAVPASAGAFPGWFSAAPLARAPWVSDTALVIASTWNSGDALVQVDVTTGAVRRITPPVAEAGSWQLLDVRDGVCAAVVSTPAAPPCLAFAASPDWAWRRARRAAPEPYGAAVEAVLAGLEWRVVDVPLPGRATDAPAEVQGILLRNRPAPGSPPPPVVLVPHGGPHSALVAGFSMPLAFLAAQGYAVLMVNYRGSTGFGQAALEALIGHAGRMDVDDCIAALDAAAAAGLVDGKRAAVFGGSHGGFLAAHLIGQTDRFACASMRNPVTDMASMAGLTDIPDWTFVETGGLGVQAYREVVSPAALAAMRTASPLAHIDAVKAPVMMLLGAKDRRVPPSNGMAYSHALRERGVPVRTLVFPEDEHALSKPRTELECYINTLEWLKLYVPSQ